MDIERVRIEKTLKTGGKLWRVGDEFEKPIPSELIAEVRAGTGTVLVLGAKVIKDNIDNVVQRAKAEAEAATALAKLEADHKKKIELLTDRIEVLEAENSGLLSRAETAEKKVAGLEKPQTKPQTATKK